MKVFDLHCGHDHRFEGWFTSKENFEQQLQAGLIQCPVCGSADIHKLPAAPRLNLCTYSHEKEQKHEPSELAREDTKVINTQIQKMQNELITAVQTILNNTEDVGERFAEEARKIHYKETSERNIRGVTTSEQAHELAEEGIKILQISVPPWMKGPIH